MKKQQLVMENYSHKYTCILSKDINDSKTALDFKIEGIIHQHDKQKWKKVKNIDKRKIYIS